MKNKRNADVDPKEEASRSRCRRTFGIAAREKITALKARHKVWPVDGVAELYETIYEVLSNDPNHADYDANDMACFAEAMCEKVMEDTDTDRIG